MILRLNTLSAVCSRAPPIQLLPDHLYEKCNSKNFTQNTPNVVFVFCFLLFLLVFLPVLVQ